MLNERQLTDTVSQLLKKQGCVLIREEPVVRKGSKMHRPDLVGYVVTENGSLTPQVVAEIKTRLVPHAQQQLMEYAKVLEAPYALLVMADAQYWFSVETSLPIEAPKLNSQRFVGNEKDGEDIVWQCLDRLRGRLSSNEVPWLVAYSLLIRAFLQTNDCLSEWSAIQNAEQFVALANEAKAFFRISIDDLVLRNASQAVDELVSPFSVLPPVSPIVAQVLSAVLSNTGRKEIFGQFVTPEPVRNFLREVVRALRISGEKVVDLAAGYGGVTFSVRDVVDVQTIVAIEIVQDVAVMAQILSIIGGYDNVRIFCGDSLHSQLDELQQDNDSDLTLVDGPFGVKSNRDELKGYAIAEEGGRTRIDLVEGFIEKAIRVTKPGGYIVVIVAEGILFNSQSQIIRDFIKKHTIIEAILSLPAHAFRPYSGIKTSTLVLRKKIAPDDTAEELFLGNPYSLEDLLDVVNAFSTWRNGGDQI